MPVTVTVARPVAASYFNVRSTTVAEPMIPCVILSAILRISSRLACACAALLGPVWTIEPGMLTINLMLLGVALALTPLILRQTKRLSAPVPLRRRMAPA